MVPDTGIVFAIRRSWLEMNDRPGFMGGDTQTQTTSAPPAPLTVGVTVRAGVPPEVGWIATAMGAPTAVLTGGVFTGEPNTAVTCALSFTNICWPLRKVVEPSLLRTGYVAANAAQLARSPSVSDEDQYLLR